MLKFSNLLKVNLI
jgi:hypothetical protein